MPIPRKTRRTKQRRRTKRRERANRKKGRTIKPPKKPKPQGSVCIFDSRTYDPFRAVPQKRTLLLMNEEWQDETQQEESAAWRLGRLGGFHTWSLLLIAFFFGLVFVTHSRTGTIHKAQEIGTFFQVFRVLVGFAAILTFYLGFAAYRYRTAIVLGCAGVSAIIGLYVATSAPSLLTNMIYAEAIIEWCVCAFCLGIAASIFFLDRNRYEHRVISA